MSQSLLFFFVYGRQIRGVSSSTNKIEIDKFIITIFTRCFLVCCVIITNFEKVLFKSFMFQDNFVKSVIIALWISFGTIIFWTNMKLNRIFVEEIIVGGFIS